MQCPYCAEKINEEAKICRHCGRELVTLAFYAEKLSSLEQEVSSLKEEIASYKQRNAELQQQIRQEDTTQMTDLAAVHLVRVAIHYWKRIAVAALLASFIFVGSNTINMVIDRSDLWEHLKSQTSFRSNLAKLLLGYAQTILAFGYLGSPLLLSYVASRKWPGSHTASYFVFGFLVGVIGLPLQLTLEFFVMNWFRDMSLARYFGNYVVPWWAITNFVITPAFMFISGGLYGDIRERRKFPRKTKRRDIALRIAERIPRVDSDRVAEGIRSLSPVLTALIGLISAVIGLYAAYKQGADISRG